jgi:hypothetical protein
MAADYEREEITTTKVRLKTRAPYDATQDIFQLLTWARHEVNKDDGRGPDEQPGYGRIWLEPIGCEGEAGAGVAVCFEKVRRDGAT